MRIPRVGDPWCSAFERYEEILETAPLDFLEEVITWVVSKISGALGALGAEALKLKDWLLRFECVSEELWFEVEGLEYFLEKSYPLGQITEPFWPIGLLLLTSAHQVRPVGIGETLRRALDMLALRAEDT